MTFDVVGFGALNLDKLYQVNKIAQKDDEAYINDLNITCGGSASNTLIGLSKLDLKTALIGKVAQDSEGEILLKNLENEGVNTKGVILSPQGRSGNVMGFVDVEGQRALYVDPGVNDLIKPEEISVELINNTKVLHLTSYVGESLTAQEATLKQLSPNIKVSLDPGRIYAEKGLKKLENILKRTDMLLLNRAELKLLTEKKYKTIKEEIESLRKYDFDRVVVKLGDKGCYATDGESSYYIDSFPVECRDTTGAGDAFNAGFLYGYVTGENLEQSCIIGNYVASCCVEDFGGTENLPDIHRVKENVKRVKLKSNKN